MLNIKQKICIPTILHDEKQEKFINQQAFSSGTL